jgi:hypothetical protein
MTKTRNRWLYTAGAAVACAAVLVTANVALAARNAAPTSFEAGAPAPSAVVPAPPEPSAAAPAPASRIIATGIKADRGEWVLYAKPIKEDAIPTITFGIMLGVAEDGKEPVDAVMANETSGSDKAPGFHAAQGSMEIDQGRSLTFGYYVGPAAKITAKAGKKKLTAGQAALDESIQVFWFDAGDLKGLTAYDAAGKKLPTGNADVGVG